MPDAVTPDNPADGDAGTPPDQSAGGDFDALPPDPAPEETFFDDLVKRMHAVMRLHNLGCDSLEKLTGKSHKRIGVDNISSIVGQLAQRIADYNCTFRIYPKELDTTKMVTFSAPLLLAEVEGYSAMPLFYEYINFLDDSYLGSGMTLRDFGSSLFFAENLSTMLRSEQWLAPFCYFRAVDLSFDRCALPRVLALVEEAERGNGYGVIPH